MELKKRQINKTGWFIIDNALVDHLGKYFGVTGLAVYMALARHVDKNQKCFPSQQTIAKNIRSTDRTVRDYLQSFLKYQLISVTREKRGGRWLNNVYTLLDRSVWIKPQEIITSGNHRKSYLLPKEIKDKNHRKLSLTKDTHCKETHIRNKSLDKINEIKRQITEKYTIRSP